MSKQQEREWERGESNITWRIGPFKVWLYGDNDTKAIIVVAIEGHDKTPAVDALAKLS